MADVLTDFPNRAAFDRALDTLPNVTGAALLLMDLDGSKAVNIDTVTLPAMQYYGKSQFLCEACSDPTIWHVGSVMISSR